MHDEEPINSNEQFEEALKKSKSAKYVLRLYVAGNTTKSAQAIATIREICEKNLKGRYTLEVVDIYQQTDLARSEQIIAAPTLIRSLPLPLRRVIGDLSSTDRVLVKLDLIPVENKEEGNHHRDNK